MVYLYTALGDSITAGESASSPGLAYPSLIVKRLRASGRESWGEVLAHPGWTSGALDAAVFDHSLEYLTNASVVTIWIGGDNLAYAGLDMLRGAPRSRMGLALASYRKDVESLVTQLQRVSRAKLILCTQYNPFPNSPIAVAGIKQLNAATEALAARHHALLAPTHAWFAGKQQDLIAGYQTGQLTDLQGSRSLPIHPNNRGHALIADRLLPYMP